MFEIMLKNVQKMTINYSPNFDPQKREKKKIEFLILHYTGMKNDKLAIQRLTSFNSNVSCHYYITSSGNLSKWCLIYILPGMQVNQIGKSINFKS